MFKFSKISIFILALASGIVICFYTMLFLFLPFCGKFSIQFDILTPLSMVITIFLAIYVAEKLNISNEKTRIEKNLIIEDLRSFKKDLFESVKCINDLGENEFTAVSSRLKLLRTKINSILKLVEKYQFCKNVDCFGKIDNKIRDIKDLFTDEAEVNNNKIILKTEQKDKANSIVNEIDSQIFELIVEINRK